MYIKKLLHEFTDGFVSPEKDFFGGAVRGSARALADGVVAVHPSGSAAAGLPACGARARACVPSGAGAGGADVV